PALHAPHRRALRAPLQAGDNRSRAAGRALSGRRRQLRVHAHRQPPRGNAGRRLPGAPPPPLTESSTIEMKAGDWLYLEGGDTHRVKGLEDSALLLTILFDGKLH